MKRLLLGLIFSSLAFAVQVYRVDPMPVMTTAGNTPVGGSPALYAVANATIALCTDAACTLPATAYTDTTGVTACPVYAPVTLPGSIVCTSLTGAQGQFGFWIVPGTYWYTVTVSSGVRYGPYPISSPTAGVTSAAAGTGITVAPAVGAITITNTGVTSNVAGAGINVAPATGASTISNTGVLSNIAGTAIAVSGATGNVTIDNIGVTSNVAGTGISVSGPTGAVTIGNTGALSFGPAGFPRVGVVVPASGDYQWSLITGPKQGNTNVPQMAGVNSGVAADPLCNDAAGNATTLGCVLPYVLPAATKQLQHLRIKPNTGNLTTTEFADEPYLVSNDYNFTPQASSGDLIAGNTLVTLTPVPNGINWNNGNNNHWLRAVGGTDPTGVCYIVTAGPGTAVSGAAAGTLTLNCAAQHRGAYTLASATNGIQESIYAAPAFSTVFVPAGAHPTYAPIVKPATAKVSIVCAGSDVANINAQFAAGNTLYVDTAYAGYYTQTVRGCGFLPGVVRTSGSELSVINAQYGDFDDLYAGSAYTAFTFENFQSPNIGNLRSTATTHYALELKCTGGSVCGGSIHDLLFSMAAGAPAGIIISAAPASAFAGIKGVNWTVQGGTYNIYANPLDGALNEIQLNNYEGDGATAFSLMFDSGAGGTGNGLGITDARISPAAGGQLAYFGKAYSHISASDWTGSKVGNVPSVTVDGATSVSFHNISIDGGNNAGGADQGLLITAASGQVVTDFSCVGCQFGLRNPPNLGLNITAAAHVGLKFEASDFRGVAAVSDNNTNRTVYSGYVRGVTNVIGTVASGAAITAPINPVFTVSGTTQIVTINGGLTGQSKTLIFTDAAPAGIGTGGNILSTANVAQNGSITLDYNGANWVARGPYRFANAGAGAALAVGGNAITLTHPLHHVGAGLIKTINLAVGLVDGCVDLVPDAAFTYDATGNIVVPAGGGTAVINKLMRVCYDGAKWTPDY